MGKTQQAAKGRPNAPWNDIAAPAPNIRFAALSAPRMTPVAIPKFKLPREPCAATYSTMAKQHAKTSDEANSAMARDLVFPLASAHRECAMSATIAGSAGKI